MKELFLLQSLRFELLPLNAQGCLSFREPFPVNIQEIGGVFFDEGFVVFTQLGEMHTPFVEEKRVLDAPPTCDVDRCKFRRRLIFAAERGPGGVCPPTFRIVG